MTADTPTAITVQVERAQALLDTALPSHRALLAASWDPMTDSFLLRGADGRQHRASVRLLAAGMHVADLEMSMRYRWLPHHRAIAIDESRYSLFVTTDRQPLVRIEFQDALTATPPSHWHLHAERGSFSALLSRTRDSTTGGRDPARLSSLHFPTGGPHFRPSLADVVEFLVVECGVDAHPGWTRAVHEYRKHWRRDEAAATARQFSSETAAALRGLGWQVTSPVRGDLPAPFVRLVPG